MPICMNQMAIFRNPRLWQHSEAGAHEVFARAKGFLSLYNNMDKGMGSFFFVYMSMSQVSWIFQLFITISSMLGEGIDFSSALFGISFGLGTMGLVLSVVCCQCYACFGQVLSRIIFFSSPLRFRLMKFC